MQLYLGIDGGGTGCRAAIADAGGQILGMGQAGPANIASDPSGARDNILIAATEALSAAMGNARVPALLPTLHAGLGLAGANAAGAVARLCASLPFAAISVASDAVAAMKGALGAQDGIVAVLGTGSVFARQQAGHIHQIGGWGLVLGDEGSLAGAKPARGKCCRARRVSAPDPAFAAGTGRPWRCRRGYRLCRHGTASRFRGSCAGGACLGRSGSPGYSCACGSGGYGVDCAVAASGPTSCRDVHRRNWPDLCRTPCRTLAGARCRRLGA